MTSQEEVDKQDSDRVKQALAALMEHFEAVHIFVTKNDGPDDSTRQISYGSGNFFARKGQIIGWVDYQRERSRILARNDFQEDVE